MSKYTKYEMILILNEELNDSELKTWAFKYARELKGLGAIDIFVTSRGKRNLAYMIKNQNKGNFIEIKFLIISSYLKQFKEIIELDENILRSLTVKKSS
tara:strand:- start:600 stop:896 length:297 start_codon:yes stop_codon:yes gene_type:complete